MTRNKRVDKRPVLEQWSYDELMTLREAAQVAFPDGLISEKGLRTAVRDRTLGVVIVAGKIYTTRRALEAMCVARPLSETQVRRRRTQHP